ncbi:antibiotic biosynthesis monooxygenase [Galbitalea sp. SE-J8]|uniref:antibiotic biosynthesis monooxygenase family protein n=1 Tax=Galbitalea sp. SE-J8 TaxID=3054952 RepID=UPI00259CB243|nr:antibiotic biosynthesis monooxygenase [Galbitalea sp. SE-J8]MDM4764199.1 antibiotic biosynthesis monooxygenase [Galbitalea sp. SE-J8]
MITEHAYLYVKPGAEADFEAAFTEASDLMAASPGFRGLTISRSIRDEGVYLLLVRWKALEDHLTGWRESQAFLEWSLLLHKYYDPFPVVDHFEEFRIVLPEQAVPWTQPLGG